MAEPAMRYERRHRAEFVGLVTDWVSGGTLPAVPPQHAVAPLLVLSGRTD
jgi:hypothetical protein